MSFNLGFASLRSKPLDEVGTLHNLHRLRGSENVRPPKSHPTSPTEVGEVRKDPAVHVSLSYSSLVKKLGPKSRGPKPEFSKGRSPNLARPKPLAEALNLRAHTLKPLDSFPSGDRRSEDLVSVGINQRSVSTASAARPVDGRFIGPTRIDCQRPFSEK